ncbi:RNA polymerase recycling motor ATPase HelR [Rhodococcus sp. G-MC3]|uniref:RNA polymerase recycling motor ATPase HelR n=1 Tax=Rhodococcus sp. G-MC3 TaxID=3046209 RepID=UPI0024B98AB5|nr:RNA polymerase recycling motor ATPase HelR [Rhodococcus sp. G-MC3]MDJ0394080.1 RNA polymerase recycling motor ATPase HelR [Rhodococcus sp. G-MC3]
MHTSPTTPTSTRSASNLFEFDDSQSPKLDPKLIAGDERHFVAVAESLASSMADATAKLDEARWATDGSGRELMERDFEVHRLTARLRSLRRFGLDLCLGHMVVEGGQDIVYIGRVGLLDDRGNQLLIDWRSPAAEPFFGATHARPMGLSRRRRYRWKSGRINDYWDEIFTADSLDEPERAALDDQSAFIASLGATRSPRMRDVLGTIQADQDAIIRAGSRGALVVDGGPGTGKTVVALHRTAFLLYSDPRLGHNHGGVLFVGPHEHYLAYVSDVLPSLGEEGVQTCTLRQLVAEGAAATDEADRAVADAKSTARMVEAIETAVRFYERPPTAGMTVETDWAEIQLDPRDWVEAFDAPDVGTPHNEAREQIWDLLVTILVDKYTGDISTAVVRNSLLENEVLRATLDNAWTLIDATDLVGDLWTVPAYLRECAPWLTTDEVRLLQRTEAHRWTTSDLPLLDAARQRLGDPKAAQRKQRRAAVIAAERRRMDHVVDEMLQLDDEDGMIAQLRQGGIRDALVDGAILPASDTDHLAGPFAHIVVDEAQELTDAEWHMLRLRCPSSSFTIVGDRAQSRRGFTESWQKRLRRAGLDHVDIATLSINYRTPEEVMWEAAPVILGEFPDANVPTSIRRSGIPVTHGHTSDLDATIKAWVQEHPDGTGCVIGSSALTPSPRIRSSTPALSKGLEFDLVVLVDPAAFGTGIEGAVDRYVAMTRATQRLVILTS